MHLRLSRGQCFEHGKISTDDADDDYVSGSDEERAKQDETCNLMVGKYSIMPNLFVFSRKVQTHRT